jgi:exosome complex component RRP43
MLITSCFLCHSFIDSTQTLHLPDLSIVSGESSWVIYADLVCLNYDGNLYDACLLALIGALKRLQLPETEVVEDGLGGTRGANSSEVCISTANHRSMPVHHTLMPTTFGIFDQHRLADPTAAEEGPANETAPEDRDAMRSFTFYRVWLFLQISFKGK